MRPVITPEEAARLDRASPEPVTLLMERAGAAVAAEAARLGAGYGRRVVVLAGPGNNGGDGYVAARYLHRRGAQVTVRALSDPKTEACRWAAEEAAALGVEVRPLTSTVHPADLVVDALFGGGFRHGLPREVAAWIDGPHPVLAVDVPTGLDPATGEVAEAAFTAVSTVTFHALKTGHLLGEGPDRCGRVVVADIGLVGGDPALLLCEEQDAPRPRRSRTAHKWSAGSVLVVGGEVGMVGAAVLAGKAALRFGAGAVGVASPQQAAVAQLAPELLSYPLDQLPDRYQVLVVGPGLGRQHGELVQRLAATHPGPLVLDADALTTVGLDALRSRATPTVLTPHAGEFRRLTGTEPGYRSAAELAADTGTVVLLKGNPTLVTDGAATWAVTSGGPELATIGTGDVLAGMVGALAARGLAPLAAARSAAHWHGRAGAWLAAAEGAVTADRLALAISRFAWEVAAS